MIKVLVTGANSGLGFSICQKYLDLENEVYALDLYTDKLESLSNERLHYFKCDVTNFEEVKSIQNEILELDLLICNAGIIDFFPLIEDAKDALKKIINVNFYGTHHCVKVFHKCLIKSKGKIGVISSESVVIPGCFQPYQISKVALEGYVNSIRTELKMRDVQITLIRPSAMKTPVLDKVYENQEYSDSEFKEEFNSFLENARKRVGSVSSAEEIALKIIQILSKPNLKTLYRIKNKWSYRLFSKFPSKIKDKMMLRVLSK